MSVINMAKEIKKVHPNFLMMYKVGSFMECYGKDAYILCYMFGYKFKETKDGTPNCGFPINITPKVTAKLEQNKINYMLIDTRNNYDVDTKIDNKNLNKYEEILPKAHKFIKIKKRIDRINKILVCDIEKEDIIEKIERIEEIINENRKI